MWTRCLTWAYRAIQGWHRTIPNRCTSSRSGSIARSGVRRCTINFLFHCFRTGSSMAATTAAYRRGPDRQTSTSLTATNVTGWAAPNCTQRNRRVSNGLQKVHLVMIDYKLAMNSTTKDTQRIMDETRSSAVRCFYMMDESDVVANCGASVFWTALYKHNE